ncbi:TetR/AcrR family transcriptional regulator [Streptomyces jumonjinensis]|uniref:TetR/AcrR family transcriptional regulator n=1 Tax=Streptomyces jumonjinensis TaxID=1945 RepID=UPI0037AF5DBE
MTTPPFQRARRPEHKEQRRLDILRAAAALGRHDGVRSVTLTDIAAGAGVHKSAVLRYFASREAVFLLLTADGWQDWADAVDEALRGPEEPRVSHPPSLPRSGTAPSSATCWDTRSSTSNAG